MQNKMVMVIMVIIIKEKNHEKLRKINVKRGRERDCVLHFDICWFVFADIGGWRR